MVPHFDSASLSFDKFPIPAIEICLKIINALAPIRIGRSWKVQNLNLVGIISTIKRLAVKTGRNAIKAGRIPLCVSKQSLRRLFLCH